jgi:hypothetical protein
VLYLDKQEDALLFTLAASSVISAEGPVGANDAVVKVSGNSAPLGKVPVQNLHAIASDMGSGGPYAVP